MFPFPHSSHRGSLESVGRKPEEQGGGEQTWRDAWAWHHSLNKAKLLWAQCTETLDVLDLQLIMSALYFLLHDIYHECICRWSFYTRWVYKIWHSAYVGFSFDPLRLSNNVRTVRCDTLDNNLTLCHIVIQRRQELWALCAFVHFANCTLCARFWMQDLLIMYFYNDFLLRRLKCR